MGRVNALSLVLAHRQGDRIHIDHVWRQVKRVF